MSDFIPTSKQKVYVSIIILICFFETISKSSFCYLVNQSGYLYPAWTFIFKIFECATSDWIAGKEELLYQDFARDG